MKDVLEGVLIRALHADDLTRLFPGESRELGQAWLAQQARGELYIAVAEVAGVPVGRRCLNFTWLISVGAVYCFAAFVLAEWQSRGIGTLLDRHAEAVARARGFRSLRHAVSKSNTRGLAWHERLGYRKVDESVQRWQEPDGRHEVDCWVLERSWAKKQSVIAKFLARRRGRKEIS